MFKQRLKITEAKFDGERKSVVHGLLPPEPSIQVWTSDLLYFFYCFCICICISPRSSRTFTTFLFLFLFSSSQFPQIITQQLFKLVALSDLSILKNFTMNSVCFRRKKYCPLWQRPCLITQIGKKIKTNIIFVFVFATRCLLYYIKLTHSRMLIRVW